MGNPNGTIGMITRQRKLLISSVGGIWLIILVFLGYQAFVLWNSRQAYEKEAGNRALSLVRLVEQHASAQIERTDMALTEAIDHLQIDDFVQGMGLPEGRKQNISTMLVERQRRTPGVLSISVTDKDGLVFANSLAVPSGTSLGNRKYFLDLKSEPRMTPIVSEALYGRVSNKWGIQVARRFDLADGSFGGMIVANLGLAENFEQFYETIGLGREDLITLRDTDNRILVRHPVRTELLGKVIGGSAGTQQVQLRVSESVIVSKSPVDQIERISAIRKLPAQPIFAIIGLERRAAMEPWLKELWQAIYFAAGALVAGTSLSYFLSNRKQVEEALLKTETRFRHAMEASNDGLWEWDISSDTAYFSPAYLRMLGYESAELPMTGKTWVGLIHPDDRQRTIAVARECIENRCNTIFAEFRMKAKDGSWRWILGRGRAIQRAPDGRALRLIGTNVDITERKAVEAQLSREHRRLATILRTAGDGIHIVDPEGLLVEASDSFLSMHGYDQTVVGRLHVSDWTLMDREESDRIRQTVLTQSDTILIETRHRRADGRIIDVEIAARTFSVDDQPFVCASARDVTERKQTEKELHLNKLAAEAANRAKSAFLANMSHEIRTPMNIIVGYTDILRHGLLEANQREQLDRIDQAARYLQGIIDDVLDMSKIEAGKLSLDLANFSLTALLSGVTDSFLSQMTGKGLEFRIEIAPEIPELLLGDALRLKQCLFNYLSNALKFTASGSTMVRVGLESRSEAGLLLRFEVEDSGIGMEPEVLPQLFAPFEQADMSTTRRFGGTGLGLALTKQLATLMGGEVGGDSVPGQGSRFWFTALLQSADGTAIEGAKIPDILPALNFAGAHVLVAEDTKTNREVMKHLLSKMELQVEMAENGQIAVEMASATSFDLILMDMRMPVMDGLSATRIIRTLPGYAETPIVALTANAFDEDRQLCLETGMNDFLTKPLRLASLQAILSKWLIQHRPSPHP